MVLDRSDLEVATLSRKWKRALELYESSRNALAKLQESAEAEMVERWSTQANHAQEKRHQNLKAMDYFLLKEVSG